MLIALSLNTAKASWPLTVQQGCQRLRLEDTVSNIAPITCVSGDEITLMGLHVVGAGLADAWPDVQNFIERVNEVLARAKAGHRFTDTEISDLRKWSSVEQIEAAILYPSSQPSLGKPYINMAPEQRAIDAAFLSKALQYLRLIALYESDLRLRDQVTAAAARDRVTAMRVARAENALRQRVREQCPGKILDISSLALASPFSIKGRCYELPMFIVAQWIDNKSALARVATITVRVDFATPPDSQVILRAVIVRGEGAYQFQNAFGVLMTVPRVQLIAQ